MDLHVLRTGRPRLSNLVIALAIAGVVAWSLQGPSVNTATDTGSGSNGTPLMVAASEFFNLETTQASAHGRGVRVPGAGAALAWADPRICASLRAGQSLHLPHSGSRETVPERAPGEVELRL